MGPLPPGWADAEFYHVTTTGRRTGRPHEVEIWCVAHGGALYLMAGSGERSDTVRNLRADSAVTVRVGDDTRPAVAAVVTDPAEDAAVRAAMVAKYEETPGELASWGATALPVRLTV
ncbi:MAG TPA: nitroreductase family deazaflavin-dependent oxidoreductase [Mycobacteriales bacterium]|jgi:deazaflavin-dependent oxidoreductase (nitroreductase family)|nr:nitroreductase family deazaflavin-dependent oxidoreductase [Mycobacteriales bacterium]